MCHAVAKTGFNRFCIHDKMKNSVTGLECLRKLAWSGDTVEYLKHISDNIYFLLPVANPEGGRGPRGLCPLVLSFVGESMC